MLTSGVDYYLEATLDDLGWFFNTPEGRYQVSLSWGGDGITDEDYKKLLEAYYLIQQIRRRAAQAE